MLLRPERRRHARLPVNLAVQHQAAMSDPHRSDLARDLSPGGLFIHTGSPAGVGEMLHVQFAPQPDARLVEAYCRVTRVTPLGMGVEFVQMDAESRSLLRRVLSN